MNQIGVLIGGKQIIVPGVIPEVDTSAMVPVATAGARVPLVIGASEGGNPNTVYAFRNFNDAKAVLRGGTTLSYLSRIFKPSPSRPGASLVLFLRACETAAPASFILDVPPRPRAYKETLP